MDCVAGTVARNDRTLGTELDFQPSELKDMWARHQDEKLLGGHALNTGGDISRIGSTQSQCSAVRLLEVSRAKRGSILVRRSVTQDADQELCLLDSNPAHNKAAYQDGNNAMMEEDPEIEEFDALFKALEEEGQKERMAPRQDATALDPLGMHLRIKASADPAIPGVCYHSKNFGTPVPPYQERSRPGFCTQFGVFFGRGLLQQARSMGTMTIDFFLFFTAGSAIGVTFSAPTIENNFNVAMMFGMAIGFCSIISSLRTFGAEKTNFWRESARGVDRAAYFFGKNLSDVPKFCELQCQC